MTCPRCSMHIPAGTLVCARCGELTPRPTGLAFDSRPPREGPRVHVAREVPLDRRGRGVRAIGPLGPVKVRPAPVQWSRGREPREERRRPQPAVEGSVVRMPLPSAVHQAKTEPVWVQPPESEPPRPRESETPAPSRSWVGRRLGAAAVDVAVLLGGVLLAAVLAFGWFGREEAADFLDRGFDVLLDGLLIGRGLGLVLAGLGLCLAFVYATLSHFLGGATLGKRVAGLRVVDREGEPLSLGLSFARTIAAAVSLGLGGLGFALALFDPEGLSLHDRVVGTRVERASDP